jgi:hypothetical protein
MIAGRRARLRLQEGVVDYVQADDAYRRQEESLLAAFRAGGSPGAPR